MSDIAGMLNYYFDMGEEEEKPRWEHLYDTLPGGNVFDCGALFGDEMPAAPEKEFEPRMLTMEELVHHRHYVEHTPEEVKQIDKSIDYLTDDIRGELPKYVSADPVYNNTINDFLYILQGVKK